MYGALSWSFEIWGKRHLRHCVWRITSNIYRLEYLWEAVHQSEIYAWPWSQDHNHFCVALSEIHTLLSAYNRLAWNSNKNSQCNKLRGTKPGHYNALIPTYRTGCSVNSWHLISNWEVPRYGMQKAYCHYHKSKPNDSTLNQFNQFKSHPTKWVWWLYDNTSGSYFWGHSQLHMPYKHRTNSLNSYGAMDILNSK
jgi:hypothetical protein